MKITPEAVKERIAALESAGELSFKEQFYLEALRLLVAGMDSEPVIIVGDDGGDALAYRRLIQSFAPGTKLYRHAQPAPVVPELRVDWQENEFSAGWNACRAAMLPAAPACTCPSGDGSLRWPCPVHPGNSPVIPDGWTGNDKANAALMMLDRIETVDPVDDDRIDGIKRIVREFAATTQPQNEPQNIPEIIPDSSVIGWLRYDYQETFKKIGGPLFILGANDPSDAWGLRYIPVIKAADSVAVSATEGTEE